VNTRKRAKEKYLLSEVLKLVLQAGLASRGGSKIYIDKITITAKENLKQDIRDKLKEFIRIYQESKIDNKKHTMNIEVLADYLTAKNREILQKRRFRLGIAQKLLNLFLKYLWVLKIMEKWKTNIPPHCPFDSKIVTRLSEQYCRLRNWTEMDDRKDYEKYVRAAQRASRSCGFNTIA
jgi:hypothetical protein